MDIKKYYTSLILVPTIFIYFMVAAYGMNFGGPIIGTLLANLVLIGSLSFLWYKDKTLETEGNYITEGELRDNRRDIIISYVLIVLLWLFGQFVFLWIYQTFGDETYTKNYANVFSDPSAIFFTIILTTIVAPIAEELLFRYVLFGRLMFKNGQPSILRYVFLYLLSSISFGLIHGTWIHQIFVIPLGLVLGMLMYKTNRIQYPIIGHILFNSMSIWGGKLLVVYKSLLDNVLVVGTMITVYIVLIVGIIGFVITRRKGWFG